MAQIVLIDYGASNLLSVRRAFQHIGIEPLIAAHPEQARGASHMVLPGVGAFGKAAAALRAAGLDSAISEHVRTGLPFLGICLGMHLMLEESEEFGRHRGLGLLRGRVQSLPRTGCDDRLHKIPHIGWSALKPSRPEGWKGTILDGLQGVAMYFVHSFVAEPVDPADRLADVEFGSQSICAAVKRDNMVGFQSHPEKSGSSGLEILRKFVTS